MERKYLYEINFVRAIACLLVVMVHVSAIYFFAYDRSHTTLTNFLTQIGRIGTPLFALLSGFLLYNQTLNREFSTRMFLKSRFVKIISPFFFWSFFYLIYKSIFRNYSFPNFSSTKESVDFIYMFLTGGAHSHLYFIVLVIQFYVLFLLIRKFLNLKSIVFLTVVSFYLNYTFINNNFAFENMYIDQFVTSRAFLFQWIFYFMLGMLLVELWPKIHSFLIITKNNRYMLLLGCVVIALNVFNYHTNQMVISSNKNVINMLTVPIAFMVLISLYYNLIMINEFIVKVFIKIGNMSMGIYLIHHFVIYLYLDYAPYNVTAYPAFIFIYFIMVVIICMIILKGLSLLPFNQYIITLVKNNNSNIDFNIRETQDLIRKMNPDDSIDRKERELYV
ncbi:acyltransferase [Sporosarcina sp. G11-34]|uniref:acyltransferase n=1 Tax=Sporosarcina sp. G11-34 TaxID=2849605 RepID=UPI0022A92584|nr:acyltransferase [Sporosarcina sp. G11-34]MCZ2258663.1 acyltransferase [Sporosarcina sp. G11-34]